MTIATRIGELGPASPGANQWMHNILEGSEGVLVRAGLHERLQRPPAIAFLDLTGFQVSILTQCISRRSRQYVDASLRCDWHPST